MNKLYIGFMSGTSLDGVDASLIKTDGLNQFQAIEDIHIPYPTKFRQKMRDLISHNHSFLKLEQELTEFHIEATYQLLYKSELVAKDIHALGFHGQTIFHNPEEGLTMQIGNPHLLSQKTGIDVVHDFRRRDVSLGGQGAPLVPIFHKLLMRTQKKPVAVLNIGGVANITYIDNSNLIAFDTGPGMALINDAMTEYFNKPFDNNGEIAAKGIVDKNITNNFLTREYFSAPYPKSLDRNTFISLKEQLSQHSPIDIISTLTYITSASIVKGLNLLPKIPQTLFLCGGGSKNSQMVKHLEELLLQQSNNHCLIKNISDVTNLNPDYIESQAFGYLAARFFQNRPSSFPLTTGVSRPNICGCLVKNNNNI